MRSMSEPAAQLFATRGADTPSHLGKYWGFRYGRWYRVQVTSLPHGGGTGGLAYAPIDRRGYPYTNSAALSDCQAVWGPLKSWGEKPPRVTKDALREKGVSDFWLRARPRKTGASK